MEEDSISIQIKKEDEKRDLQPLQKPHRQRKQMRNKGICGKGLRVGECEVARTYTYLLHIYYTKYTKTHTHKNIHIPLHICKSIIPFLLCAFINHTLPIHTHLQSFIPIYKLFPVCFSLFRFSLNNGYSYSMTYSFPIFLHRFPYFLANLLIFNCLCINDFFAIFIGVFLIGRVILLFLSKSAAFAR